MNPTQPTTYTVKQGDTLNKIASSYGFANYKDAGITGFGDNPDRIQVGQTLTIGGANGPRKQEIPGVGTMTITPKAIQTGTPQVDENIAGMYERAGLKQPQLEGATPEGYVLPSIAGLPVYGSTTKQGAIVGQYNSLVKTIDELEGKIASSSVKSAEEKRLQQELNDAKARLKRFDVETLGAQEGLRGQGRGATLGSINTQETILNRTRALERLGIATEADILATQLSTAQADRADLGEYAKTQYNLATKRFDLALGIQDEIDKINDKDKDEARQYLLDVVNFADGKAYSALDSETQQAIMGAVANSPLTLDMVKTALDTGAKRFAAQQRGELRTVSGVGVVQIDPATGRYSVVVPEVPTSTVSPDVPTFEEYLADQNIPIPALTENTIAQVRKEYDTKYGNTTVNLGKLSTTQKNDLTQAGLTGAPAAVQSYFLNTPSGFQDEYRRNFASGTVRGTQTLQSLNDAYTKWFNENNKKSGTRDWSSLLGQ